MKKVLWCVIGLVALLVVAALLSPVFAREREKARYQLCYSNLRQIAICSRVYSEDWDGRLPDATRWQDQLLPYVENPAYYDCPSAEPSAHGGYAMNPRLSCAQAGDYPNARDLIVFYDADEAGHPVARHAGRMQCVFLDGHVYSTHGIPENMDIGATPNVAPRRQVGPSERPLTGRQPEHP